MFIDIMLTVALGVLVLGWIVHVHRASDESKELAELQTNFFILKDKTRDLDNKIWELRTRLGLLEISTSMPPPFPVQRKENNNVF